MTTIVRGFTTTKSWCFCIGSGTDIVRGTGNGLPTSCQALGQGWSPAL